MKRTVPLFALAIFIALSIEAQDRSILFPSFGIEAGVPLNQMFSTYSITALDYPVTYTPYSYSVPRYQVGAYANFHLVRHFGFEVDGLYSRGSFSFEQPINGFFSHTRFNDWQLPFMFEYTATAGHIHPFVDLGASFRHIAGVNTSFYGPSAVGIPSQSSSDVLRNQSSWGGVAGAGIALKAGPLAIRPQLRYTRWINQSFNAVGLTNSLNETVLMLGIGF